MRPCRRHHPASHLPHPKRLYPSRSDFPYRAERHWELMGRKFLLPCTPSLSSPKHLPLVKSWWVGLWMGPCWGTSPLQRAVTSYCSQWVPGHQLPFPKTVAVSFNLFSLSVPWQDKGHILFRGHLGFCPTRHEGCGNLWKISILTHKSPWRELLNETALQERTPPYNASLIKSVT